jgi:class 3 adenylate cyclase
MPAAPALPMIELSTLTMTEIIRLQNQLQQELTRRFERQMLLVFSDIVGSTPYFARFGDAAGRQLQQLHFDLLAQCYSATGGRIVDTAGDGAFCAFPSADAAVQGLIALQLQMARENAARGRQHQLQLRIGMHWGPVLSDGVVVSGDAVNLCARVASSAEPGEIRLTREVFQELGRAHRLDCRTLGSVMLKGVVAPVEVLGFDWRDPALFPRRLRIEETREELVLPQQDIVTFGRLTEHDGVRANDVVLTHPEPESARQISRWHFELRRGADGLRLRALSDVGTSVDGQPVPRGGEAPVRSGSVIRVAEVLTLTLLGPQRPQLDDDADSTMMVRTARQVGVPR